MKSAQNAHVITVWTPLGYNFPEKTVCEFMMIKLVETRSQLS